MNVHDVDLGALTEEVWSMMLGLEVAVREVQAAAEAFEPMMLSLVQISGEWNGVVALHCPESLAAVVTCAMFEMEPDELDAELINDALGEVINMLGGNLKTQLSGSTSLSLPTVIRGKGVSWKVSGQKVASEAFFETDGVPFLLSVCEIEGVQPT